MCGDTGMNMSPACGLDGGVQGIGPLISGGDNVSVGSFCSVSVERKGGPCSTTTNPTGPKIQSGEAFRLSFSWSAEHLKVHSNTSSTILTSASADFLQFVVTAASRIQSFTVCKSSPGTHTFLLSVQLPHLLATIPYSYRT